MSHSHRLLTDNLVAEVRSLLSERNGEGLDDGLDILPGLNRAQDKACSILAKHHADPLIKIIPFPLQAQVVDYPIPEDALEDRLVKMEVNINGRYLEMRRVRSVDFGQYEIPVSTSIPQVYGVHSRSIRILPASTAAYPLRLHYLFQPPVLALQEGRITSVNEGGNYITIDTQNTELSASIQADEAYLSLIDGQTGQRKAIMQIASFTTTPTNQRITFYGVRPAGSKATIDGAAISTSLVDLTIVPDDYICFAPATCISILRAPVLNFMISYTAAILQESAFAGQGSTRLQTMADEFEKDIAGLWAGQEQDIMVKAKSSIWGGGRRRASFPYPTSTGN